MMSRVITRSRAIQLSPILVGMLIVLGGAAFLITHPRIHPGMLFDDWAAFFDYQRFDIHPYINIFSALGFVLWISGGAFCLLAAFTVVTMQQRISRSAGYLIGLALLGFYLGLDDMIQLHEWWIPYYLHFSEFGVQATYFTLFFVFVVSFRKQLRERHIIYFAAFVGLFMLSQGVDLFRDVYMPMPDDYNPLLANPTVVILEEGFKFLAIIAFAIYCLNYSVYVLSNVVTKATTESRSAGTLEQGANQSGTDGAEGEPKSGWGTLLGKAR